MFSSIALWLLREAFKETVKYRLNVLFKGNLDKRLNAIAEAWRNDLPTNESLISIEALLPQTPYYSLDKLPPPAESIYIKLENSEIPNEEDWTEALYLQWKWVKATIPEPQALFLIPKEQARAKLAVLGKQFAIECQKVPELFQLECLKNQRVQIDELKNIQQQFQDNSSSTEEIKSIAKQTLSVVTDLSSQTYKNHGEHHAEIDAAVKHTQEGTPDIAIFRLEQLRKNNWDTLTPRERYRVLANLGHAFNAKEDYKEAACNFINCKQHQPDDEQARCCEAIGFSMQGNSEHAFELASAICADFPNSDLAHAIRVRNSPNSISVQDIERDIPKTIRSQVETAYALSRRAFESDNLDIAEDYARIALSDDASNAMLMEQLGVVLLELGRKEAIHQFVDSPKLSDPHKLNEAKRLFENILKKTPIHNRHILARMRHYLGHVFLLLGEQEKADEHFYAAYDIDGTNPQYACNYAITLLNREEKSRAIDILRNSLQQSNSVRNLLLLSRILLISERTDDHNEAIILLTSKFATLIDLDIGYRTDVIEVLVSLYCKTKQFCEADKALNELSPGIVPSEAINIILAQRYRRESRLDEALIKATDAIKCISSQTKIKELRRIASELMILGMYEEAYPIWKKLSDPRSLNEDTRPLLHCAIECDDAMFITDFCAKLRLNGVADRFVLHTEIDALQEYNCFNRAVEIMTEFLSDSPKDSSLTKEIRARLSRFAIFLGREDLARYDVNEMPSFKEVDVNFGLAIVEVLSHGPEPIKGIEFAYELVRRNFQSHLAHKAMVASVLFGRRQNEIIPEPQIVGPGMAVLYKENDTGRDIWHIIEDGENPNQAINEYSPEHGISKVMLGRQVSEEFILHKDEILERTATILAVWSKYKYRFNRCMEEWENRFPEEIFFWKFLVQKDEDDKPDFSPILKTVDQRIKETKEREEIYRYNPLSVTNFATMMHSNVLDALQHLGSVSDLPIRCCRGTEEEFIMAKDALNENMPLIIDGSALASLYLTNSYSIINKLGIKLMISEGTLHEWRKRYIEKLNSPREGRFLTKSENHYVLVEESSEAIEDRLGKYKDFLQLIESCAKVEDGMPLNGMKREARMLLLNVIGRPAAETIAIARNKGYGIWTDDLFIADYAIHNESIRRVWTEEVFRWGHAKGTISKEARNELILNFLQYGYFYTLVDEELIRWVGDRSSWSISNNAFESLINWFSNPFTNRQGFVRLAIALLVEISHNASPFQSDNAITYLLTKISQRTDGIRIINEIHRYLGTVGIVDAVTAKNLRNLIYLWGNI